MPIVDLFVVQFPSSDSCWFCVGLLNISHLSAGLLDFSVQSVGQVGLSLLGRRLLGQVGELAGLGVVDVAALWEFGCLVGLAQNLERKTYPIMLFPLIFELGYEIEEFSYLEEDHD